MLFRSCAAALFSSFNDSILSFTRSFQRSLAIPVYTDFNRLAVMSEQNIYLVTGANGYIASALVKQLVDEGNQVRATVRRKEAGEALQHSMSSVANGTLEIAIVSDITAKGAFKSALQGVTHVFHAASPIPGEGKADAKRDFLDPALAGTLSLFEDAHATSSVKKIVLTSSVASILDTERLNTGEIFTDADWNPITYDYAIALGDKLAHASPEASAQLAMAIYAASKKAAEEAAWKFVEDNKSSFQLAAVHPAFVVGRPTLGGMGGTNGMLWQLLTTRPVQSDGGLTGHVDLQDVVKGHIRAMERDAANGKRFLLVSEQVLHYQLINWAKEHRPDLPFDKVEAPADADAKEKSITKFDTSASQEVLGIKYKSVKQTVADFVDWAVEATKAQ